MMMIMKEVIIILSILNSLYFNNLLRKEVKLKINIVNAMNMFSRIVMMMMMMMMMNIMNNIIIFIIIMGLFLCTYIIFVYI